jgi:putative salt-induced outer membrane protein YdiY
MKTVYILTIATCLCAATALGEEAAATNAPPKSPPWEASATLGLTLTRGNSKTTLVAGNVQADRKWDKNELAFGADGVYGEDNGVNNAESVHAFGQYNRLFTERVFGFFRAEGLYDGIADIDYRFTLSAGGGYYLIKTTNLFLRAELGPGYVFEKVGGKTDEYATLRIAERLEWKISAHSKLWEAVEYLPQVTKFENYVVNAELGVDTAITKNLSQSTFLLDTYRSEPAPGRLHNDLKLVVGVKYKLL